MARVVCRPEPLRALFAGAGLQDVGVRALDIPTDFRGWRAALRERLRATLPVAADGTIHLTARAGAVRGAAQPSV
jgi:hypothetical protein